MNDLERQKKIADDFMVESGEDTLPTPIVRYKVQIVETLKRTVIVELPLDCYGEARQKVQEMYDNEEIVLSGDDYFDTEIECLGCEY